MNKSRHSDVKIVDAEAASDLVNSPRFSTLDELSDTCFEVIIDIRIFSVILLNNRDYNFLVYSSSLILRVTYSICVLTT